ncbi:MAG: choice-of-anchor D domain-containing protein, partial [Bacteroidia bacterium]|nr:choice-of-anchor D domain-containing protein [Bacteroidia bacterium]
MKKLLSLVIGLITTQILIGQEIDVTGKNISIPSGSATYTSKRNTFFGYQVSSQGSITKTFTIKNYGYSNLTIGVVTATGDFTVTAQPVSPVAPGGFTTFTVTYDPSTIATHTGTITVPNNDANEGTYTFGVQGVGLNVATQRQVRWVHNGVLSRPTTVVLQGVTYNVVPTTYTTVQTAINAAAQYDIVYITDGRYFNPREAVSTNCSFIGLGQDLALYDSIQNKNNIIITSQTGDHTTSNARLVGYGFNLKGGNDITIQGLELDSVRVNAFWNSNCCTYNPATDVKILNNSINGTHGHGIKTDYWASGQGSVIDRGAWEISGNTFANIGYYNGYFNNCTPASVSAMWLGEAGGCFLIDGNTITNVRWAAVLCNGYGDAFTSANGAVTISNNTINSTIDAGIQLGWNYGGNGYSAGYRNSYVTGNYIQNANTSHAAGIGAIVIHISFVGNTNILMNHITSSYNGVAINIAGWNNSMAADTARIQYNNFCGLVAGSSAITHIGGQNGNGFWGTPDNLGKYKCDNNYYGSASGPTYYLNPGGIGWELKEETTLIGPGNPYSQGDFAFLPFRTIPYPNPLVPACQCEPNSSNTIVTACGSYLWNSVTYTTSGTYSHSMPNAGVGGCDSVAYLVLTISNPSITALSQTNVSCFGGTNGSAAVNAATGGIAPYSYNWTPGNPTGDGTTSVTGLSAGTWTCTVTDAASCTGTGTFNITSPSAITVTPSSQTNVSCFGGTNGAASINTPTGGAGGYTYNWTPGNPTGDGTTSVTGLTAGTWTCTVTDANLCVATVTFNIVQPGVLTLSPSSQSSPLCFGYSTGSAQVQPATGGTPGYTYNWSPAPGGGQGTTTAFLLSAQTYTCTVTDANGCQSSLPFTLTQPPALVSSAASQTNVSCFGGSNGTASIVAPSGGTPGYTMDWEPGSPSGEGTISASGLTAGTWTCTVTDNYGCITTVSFNVTSPSALSTVAASQTNVSCNGGSNGAASINTPTGGAGGYTYNWTPGNPTGDGTVSVTGLAAGTWTCTVTDANSCTATQTFNITAPSAIVVTAASQTNVSCFGGTNGAASINTPTGGAGGYTYNWTPGNPTGDGTVSVTGLSAGTWTCTVTDANSCTTTQTFNITAPSAIVVTAASQTNTSCFGGSNGAASINTPTGGAGGYTYNWTPGNPTGDGTVSVTALAAGTWTCTVTDANSCTATQTFNITSPSVINVTAASATYVSCFGESNGAASINTPTGGAGGFTYNWTPGNPTGDGTTSVTGLTAGTWTCTVTDANSCTATQTFNITQPTQVVASAAAQTNVLCNGAATGAATVAASGGIASYSYSWAPSGGTAATATGLTAGTYTATVTDGNGCTATQTFNITQPSALSATTMQTNVSCNAGSNGDAMVMVSGGTGTYTYSWAPSGGSNATATGLSAGTYTCTTTDANGCTITNTFNITAPSALVAGASSQTNVSCNGGSNGAATVGAAGGAGSYTYSWSPSGGTAATATGLAAGVYTVTVTDANSC